MKEKHNQLLVQMDIIYYKHHVKLVNHQVQNAQLLVNQLVITLKELELMLHAPLVHLELALVLIILMLLLVTLDITYKELFVLL